MSDDAREADVTTCLGMRLTGDIMNEVDERGSEVVSDTLIVLFNASRKTAPFTLLPHKVGQRWEFVLDTARPDAPPGPADENQLYPLHDRSMAVFRIQAPPTAVRPPTQAETLTAAVTAPPSLGASPAG